MSQHDSDTHRETHTARYMWHMCTYVYTTPHHVTYRRLHAPLEQSSPVKAREPLVLEDALAARLGVTEALARVGVLGRGERGHRKYTKRQQREREAYKPFL
jgi:hypothetical protein